MKKILVTGLVLGAFYSSSVHAFAIGNNTPCDNVTPGGMSEVYQCVALLTTSIPTLIVAADLNEMNSSDKMELIKAEAQNFLAGIDGEYPLLNATAKAMNQSSLEFVATEILK